MKHLVLKSNKLTSKGLDFKDIRVNKTVKKEEL